MSLRYRSIVDVYVLLQRSDGHILLLERAHTGYADGQLCPPSGHLDEGESVTAGAIREAAEEVGVELTEADLTFVHVVHYRNANEEPRIGFFFLATTWTGQPVNREPHKCARILWADPAHPPADTVPYTAVALVQITHVDRSPCTAGTTHRPHPDLTAPPRCKGTGTWIPMIGTTTARRRLHTPSARWQPGTGWSHYRQTRRRRSTSPGAALSCTGGPMPDLAPEQYYPSLPTKRMGAGVLFTNHHDHVLLVKPTYQDGWEVPGGTVEADEGPYAAAHREIIEELGMTRAPGALLVVDWVPQRGVRTEALMLVFDGGRLTDADIAGIVLPATELHSFAFCDPDEAAQRLSPLLARRVAAALHARAHGAACLHNGYSVYPHGR